MRRNKNSEMQKKMWQRVAKCDALFDVAAVMQTSQIALASSLFGPYEPDSSPRIAFVPQSGNPPKPRTGAPSNMAAKGADARQSSSVLRKTAKKEKETHPPKHVPSLKHSGILPKG